jgi:hypothetical protein
MNLKTLLTKKDFSISEKKEYIPCDLRPPWKMSLLILITGIVGYRNKLSRNKAHLIIWILKNDKHLTSYIEYTDNLSNDRPIINLDPALDKAIDYALFSNLITVSKNKITLTEKGKIIFTKLENSEIFSFEKSILNSIKSKFSEEKVKNAFEGK